MHLSKDWVKDHDSNKVFLFLYIGLSLVLSIVFGLFWLLLFVFFHFLIEMFANKRRNRSFIWVFFQSIWEVKLDFGLVLFAICLSLYLDFIFGIAGIGVGARAVAQTGKTAIQSTSRIANSSGNILQTATRFAGWQRIVRSFLLTIDDFGIAIRGAFSRQKSHIKHVTHLENIKKEEVYKPEKIGTNSTNWSKKWQTGDILSFVFGCFCLILILVSPIILQKSIDDIIRIIRVELHPFP